jgi:hypothetical protein
MATQRIALGEWLPDQPSVVGTMQDANNVIPIANGYAPFPLSVNYSNAASDTLTNVFAGRFNAITQLFAGSSSKLYKFNAGTLNLDDVSKTGGYSGSRWYFTQFGDLVIAANNTNKLQSWTINSSSNFADLAAAAPIAKFVTTVRDFVVSANLDSGSSANKVQWSNINDATNWTAGAASQSDFQIIADGGNITGITGGEFGLVLLERGIVRMSYIGSPYFFQFDNISRGIGCIDGGSVAQYGGVTYFLSDNGFYACDGKSVEPIGTEKVDRFFFSNANINQIDTISAAADPINKLVVWNYANTSGGRSLLIYNWQIKKWSQGSTDVDYIAPAATSGVTLEALDSFGTVDSIGTSWDDRVWAGGKYLFAGVDGGRIITFTGANSTAKLIIGDTETGYNGVINLIRSQVQGGSFTASVASRRQLQDAVTFGTTVTASSEGRASVRSAGRYHRFYITPTGVWSNILSIDIDYETQGTR